jgi:Holliday junction resolvasome RuvABC endonuclease subunit
MPAPVTPTRRYLGLDMSKTGTGLVVLSSSVKGTEVADSFTISAKAGQDRVAFLMQLSNELDRVMARYKPVMACIEGYAHAAKFQAHYLGEIGGIARLSLYSNLVKFAEVAPASLKQFVMGMSGKADKKEMVRMVKSRWGFATKDHNLADAYGLARLALVRGEQTGSDMDLERAAKLTFFGG